MPPIPLPLTGSCRCGQALVSVTAAPLITAACHCTGCQTMSGSAFSLTAIFPRDAFSVVQGETVIGGLRGPELQHHFCPSCMTWMFTRIVDIDQFINVRPTLFADRTWFTPFIETMTAEKLPWAETPARHRFEGFPPVDQFQALMADYAATG